MASVRISTRVKIAAINSTSALCVYWYTIWRNNDRRNQQQPARNLSVNWLMTLQFSTVHNWTRLNGSGINKLRLKKVLYKKYQFLQHFLNLYQQYKKERKQFILKHHNSRDDLTVRTYITFTQQSDVSPKICLDAVVIIFHPQNESGIKFIICKKSQFY